MATSTMCAVITAGDLFAALPDASRRERFDTMLMQDGVRLERIVSNGQATPSGEWYDQPQNEWVLLLAGEALIRIEFEEELRRLSVGQWIMLPAHCVIGLSGRCRISRRFGWRCIGPLNNG